MEPLQGTASGQNSIQRVRYSHDAMIDLIIANPAIKQGEIAKWFGYTEGWVSRVMGSDAFQARLAERKDEIVTPELRQNLQERLQGLAFQSLQIIEEKLETKNTDLAFKTLELSVKALGFGARSQNIQQQNNYVVALPPKIDDEKAWAKSAQEQVAAAKTTADLTIEDVTPKEKIG